MQGLRSSPEGDSLLELVQPSRRAARPGRAPRSELDADRAVAASRSAAGRSRRSALPAAGAAGAPADRSPATRFTAGLGLRIAGYAAVERLAEAYETVEAIVAREASRVGFDVVTLRDSFVEAGLENLRGRSLVHPDARGHARISETLLEPVASALDAGR